MKNKIILMSKFYLPNIGGIENSLFKLSQSLKSKGYSVKIITTNINNVSDEKLKQNEIIDGVEIVRVRQVNNRFLSEFLFHFYFIKELLKEKNKQKCIIIARNHYNVIHSALTGFNKISYLIPGVIKYQNNSHNLSSTLKSKASLIITSFFQFLAFKYSSYNFVFSNNMIEQVNNVADFNDKLILTKPGVDFSIFNVVGDDDVKKIRTELNLPLNKKLILGLGRFVKAKGFSDIVEIMGKVPDDYVLILVGDGPEKDNYIRVIKTLGLNNVIIHGPTSKPDLYYKAADSFMMSSLYEPLGQTILEAQSCGLPVIYYSKEEKIITACDEIIYKNINRTMYYNNNKSIIEAIINTNCEYKEKIELNEYIKNHYSWDILSEDLIKEYE